MIHRLSSQGVFSLKAVTRKSSSTRGLSAQATRCIHNYLSRNAAAQPCHRNPAYKRSIHASASLSASSKDPYQVLGVKKDASAAEIKKIYFSLARKYHPDTNSDKGARDKFVEIQDAYDILKDDKKRSSYDKYGAASQQPGFDPDARSPFGAGAGGFSGFSGFGNPFGGGGGGGGGQAELFEQLFGRGFGGSRSSGFAQSSRGNDLQVNVGVTFMEAMQGTTRSVNTTPVETCKPCSGKGLKKGAQRSPCKACGGSGTRTFVIDSGFQMASTCQECAGTGSTIPKGSQCGDCSGLGKVRVRKTVKIDIPAGIEDGTTLRMPSAGDAPLTEHGTTGDLLIRVNVSPSKIFRRQGTNLHHTANIPMHTAILGGRVRVPTLDGGVDVRVPGGTQHGEEMILRGRGVTAMYSTSKGDLMVAFSIQLPRSLTARQREIFQLYADDVEGRSPAASTPQYAPEEPYPSTRQPSDESKGNDNATKEQTTETTNAASPDEPNPQEDTNRTEKKRATAH